MEKPEIRIHLSVSGPVKIGKTTILRELEKAAYTIAKRICVTAIISSSEHQEHKGRY